MENQFISEPQRVNPMSRCTSGALFGENKEVTIDGSDEEGGLIEVYEVKPSVLRVEAVQTTSPVQGGLTKAMPTTALARRPLLAARLALMRRMNHAMQTTLLAEVSATSALSATANATTTTAWAVLPP